MPLPGSAAFVRESPLSWQATRIPVLAGYFTYGHKITFADPCAILDGIDMAYAMRDKHKDELADWCRIKLKLVFWDPIKAICRHEETALSERYLAKAGRFERSQPPTNPKPMKSTRTLKQQFETVWLPRETSKKTSSPRNKRVAIIAVIGLVILFNALYGLVLGIASTALEKTNANAAAIAIQEDNMRIIEELNLQHHASLKLLTPDLLNITRRLNQLETEFNGVVNALPMFTTTVADVSHRMAEIKRMTKNIATQWNGIQPRQAPSFFEMFNVTNYLMPHSLLDEAEPDDCAYSEAAGQLTHLLCFSRKT